MVTTINKVSTFKSKEQGYLIQKYNIAAPRYTSYPTVPYWQKEKPTSKNWLKNVQAAFEKDNDISLYIHLPFCESLCTYCGCNKRITKNHQLEVPYIKALLKEWQLYLAALPYTPIIRELHLGGGTPTFFNNKNSAIITPLIKKPLLTKI